MRLGRTNWTPDIRLPINPKQGRIPTKIRSAAKPNSLESQNLRPHTLRNGRNFSPAVWVAGGDAAQALDALTKLEASGHGAKV